MGSPANQRTLSTSQRTRGLAESPDPYFAKSGVCRRVVRLAKRGRENVQPWFEAQKLSARGSIQEWRGSAKRQEPRSADRARPPRRVAWLADFGPGAPSRTWAGSAGSVGHSYRSSGGAAPCVSASAFRSLSSYTHIMP